MRMQLVVCRIRASIFGSCKAKQVDQVVTESSDALLGSVIGKQRIRKHGFLNLTTSEVHTERGIASQGCQRRVLRHNHPRAEVRVQSYPFRREVLSHLTILYCVRANQQVCSLRNGNRALSVFAKS